MYLLTGKDFSGVYDLARLLKNKGLREAKFYTNNLENKKDSNKYIFVDKINQRHKKYPLYKRYKDGSVKYFTYDQIKNYDFLVVKPHELFSICRNSSMEKFKIIYVSSSEDERLRLLEKNIKDTKKISDSKSKDGYLFEKFDYVFLTGEYLNDYKFKNVREFYDVFNDYKDSLNKFVDNLDL